MKRWVLSKIVSDPEPGLGNVYRMAIQRYPDLDFAFGEIPVDPDTGIPTKLYGFALIASKNMARFAGDPNIDVLPDFPLDGKISAMHGPTKAAMLENFVRYGIPTGIVNNADGFRDVVRGIGRTINASFVEDAFDVSEA